MKCEIATHKKCPKAAGSCAGCAPPRPQPAHLRDDDRRRRELLVSDAARAGVPHGLIAGRYRFADFLKIGSVLTLLIYGVAIVLVPLV